MPTPTANGVALTTDCSNRTAGPLNMIVLHHAATTDLQAILNLFQPGGRQVSAHRAVKDGQNYETVPEAKRAWSLSDAYWDSRSFTVECANESTVGWTISQASHETLAQQCASWAQRYGFPIIRSGDPKTWTLLGHREVYEIWGGSYATACPGGMNLDWIAARANQILNPPMEEDDDMSDLMYLMLPKGSAGASATLDTYVLISPSTLEFGFEKTTDVNVANAYSLNYGGPPVKASTQAMFDASIELAKKRREVYLQSHPVGGGSGGGGFTAADRTRLAATATAEKLAEVKSVVDKTPTAAANAKATNDDAAARMTAPSNP